MGPTDLTIQLIAFRVLALPILVGVHGGIVAGVAVFLGDKGPKYDGRLTAAPTRHVDLVGAISLFLFGLGWSKPVDVDAQELRVGRIGLLAMVLAGFAGLILAAALLHALVVPALTTLPHTAALASAAFLRAASGLAIWFALLSLVPIPPLAGGLLLGGLGIRVSRQVERLLAALLLVCVATGVARQLLAPAHAVLASAVFGQ